MSICKLFRGQRCFLSISPGSIFHTVFWLQRKTVGFCLSIVGLSTPMLGVEFSTQKQTQKKKKQSVYLCLSSVANHAFEAVTFHPLCVSSLDQPLHKCSNTAHSIVYITWMCSYVIRTISTRVCGCFCPRRPVIIHHSIGL